MRGKILDIKMAATLLILKVSILNQPTTSLPLPARTGVHVLMSVLASASELSDSSGMSLMNSLSDSCSPESIDRGESGRTTSTEACARDEEGGVSRERRRTVFLLRRFCTKGERFSRSGFGGGGSMSVTNFVGRKFFTKRYRARNGARIQAVSKPLVRRAISRKRALFQHINNNNNARPKPQNSL